ncbi:hypothetical protein H257_04773 [Aphanomyces astaci]|uniref:Uncharacterized protein n=1 Tax=Aphanomyces astaci TaxID=112090 RepID=W4GUP5_APHAT|nr:hypothetical protein H257_04773 [Aphanomyces astaci]ETV83031.1 hypothetical protein H257_04773 [Aphanomyces astaci]|eukprot:XP_009827702.1 hypothetical protein H257_04773 [Aphanomyces astaci]
MKLHADEWPRVPLVQGALNHQPVERMGGIAPLTAFTGLSAKTPVVGFVHPKSKEVYVADWLGDARENHVMDLQETLEETHGNVEVRIERLRQQARGRRDRKSQVKFAGFSVGDFVLVGLVVNRPAKLALHWRGPCQVTTDHDDGGFAAGATRLDEARCMDGQQVLVKWLAHDDDESSSEPEANLLDDIPVVFRKWAAANREDTIVAALIKTLDFPQEERGSFLQCAEQLGRALISPISPASNSTSENYVRYARSLGPLSTLAELAANPVTMLSTSSPTDKIWSLMAVMQSKVVFAAPMPQFTHEGGGRPQHTGPRPVCLGLHLG